jgi:hypothetical protein
MRVLRLVLRAHLVAAAALANPPVTAPLARTVQCRTMPHAALRRRATAEPTRTGAVSRRPVRGRRIVLVAPSRSPTGPTRPIGHHRAPQRTSTPSGAGHAAPRRIMIEP